MVKTICKSVILLATALLIVAAVGMPAANAQLASMAYGFPQIFHNAEVTSFDRDILNQVCNEYVNVDFGAAGLYGLGAFPTISQVSESSTYAESTSYYHSEETDAIGYPFVSVGSACAGLPGLGALPYYSGYGGWC